MTDKEIYDKFREVSPAKLNYISYFRFDNAIYLDGHFASDELREIARVMDEIYHGNKKTLYNLS